MKALFPWTKTETAQVPELEQSMPLLFNFFSAFLNTFARQLSTSFSDYSFASQPLCELFSSYEEMQSLAVWLASLPEEPWPSQIAKKQQSSPKFSRTQHVSWHSCFLGPDPIREETYIFTAFKLNTQFSCLFSALLFFFFFLSLFPTPKMLKKFMELYYRNSID